jgi:hypothetical protein
MLSSTEANTKAAAVCCSPILILGGSECSIGALLSRWCYTDDSRFIEELAFTRKDIRSCGVTPEFPALSQHVFGEDILQLLDTAIRVVLVAEAGVVWRSFVGMKVEGVWVSLGSDVVTLLLAFDTATRGLVVRSNETRGGFILSA